MKMFDGEGKGRFQHKTKKAWGLLLIAFLLYAAMQLRLTAQGDFDTVTAPLLRNAIHIGMLLIWCISVRSRVMQSQALKLLMVITGLILFWLVIRLFKYEFVINPTILRYLWYLYYLPILFIPLCEMFAAMLLGKSELARLPKSSAVPACISAVLFLFVMTNDFHQLVFCFPADQPWNSSDYTYGPIYYCIFVWLIFCGLSFLVTLLYKCRIPQSRRFIWLPCVPVLILLIYTALYLLRVRWLFVFFGDMPVAFCLCYIAILECCMQAGLIQTNTGYDILFEAAWLRVQITDEDWNTCYRSRASSLDAATLRQAETAPVQLDRNTLLKTNRISGGHVAWLEDITEIANILEQLDENQQELADENYLEQEVLRAKQEVHLLQEKNRLYDLIGRETKPQVALLDSLLEEYVSTEGENSRRRLLEKSCVIGAYIKRYGNLLLIRESSATASVTELMRALEESMQNLELAGVQCGLTYRIEESLPTAVIVDAYACFERIIEAFLGRLFYLWVTLRVKDRELLLHLEAETDAEPPTLEHAEIETEDGVRLITVRYSLGGEQT